MESDTLKKYFQLCKENDYNQIVFIIDNSENPKYSHDPHVQAVNKLKKYYSEEQVDPVDNLMDLYNRYHVMKGGDTLSSITNFLKKNVSVDKLKSAALSSAKVVGSLLKSAAKTVYESAKKDPEGTVKFMKTIHESTTKVLINDIIKNESTKKTINDSFEKIFNVVLESLKDSSGAGAGAGASVAPKQVGGYDSYGSNYLDLNYRNDYKDIESDMEKKKMKYGSDYINKNYGNNYKQIGGDINNYLSHDENISETSDMDTANMEPVDFNPANVPSENTDETFEYQPYEY